MRKTILVSVASLALSTVAAWSADLRAQVPYKAEPIAPRYYNWTGFYVGGHLAGARSEWSNTDTLATFSPIGTITDNDASGLLAGGQIGYNYQIGTFLVGIEGDYAFADVRNTTAMPFPAIGFVVSNRLKSLATVTGRIGWVMDRWMIYAKGGVAWGRNDTDVIFPAVFDFAGSDTRSGWPAGAGAEMAVMGNWTVKLEYDYIDFGTRSVTLSSALLPAITPTFDVKQVLHEVKLGVNYRFNVF